MPDRTGVLNILVHQCRDRSQAHIRNAHADGQAEHKRSVHQALSVLELGTIVLVDMQRVLVHGHEAEHRVVEFGNRPAGPMAINFTHFKIFVVSALTHV